MRYLILIRTMAVSCILSDVGVSCRLDKADHCDETGFIVASVGSRIYQEMFDKIILK